ncbi:MAG TPA: response regulator [Candidatus Sulfotelmatobacter sp.]|nr:response regulator [Candidatus Sulfotelmatobacter sp.]
MNSVKVLCVEHTSEYLEAMKDMLETAGYDVVCATTGRQGMTELTNNSIQGVLLEYDLPDMSGAFVKDEMKRIKPDVPVLLFSGIGGQTPFMLRFFDSYVRNVHAPEQGFRELEER